MARVPERDEIFKRLCLFGNDADMSLTICAEHQANLGSNFLRKYVRTRHCLWKDHVGKRRLDPEMDSRPFTLKVAQDLFEAQDNPKIRMPFDGLYCRTCNFMVSSLLLMRKEMLNLSNLCEKLNEVQFFSNLRKLILCFLFTAEQ